MKYLDSKPFNIAISDATEHRPQVVENGGPATRIPDDAKCPSGRHNTRLTECYCKPQQSKPAEPSGLHFDTLQCFERLSRMFSE